MVVLDMMAGAGLDALATQDIKIYEAIIGGLIFQSMGFSVQVMELTDYSNLWFRILILTVLVFILAFFKMPETMMKDERKKGTDTKDLSTFGNLFNEVMTYAALLKDFRCRRYLLIKFNENVFFTFMMGGVSAMLM